MEALIILLFVALIVVSLMANAFRKDGDDARVLIRKLDSEIVWLRAELASRPTMTDLKAAQIAAAREVVTAIAQGEGEMAAMRARARMAEAAKAGFRQRH